MKTNAASGVTGTPLSHQAVQSGRDGVRHAQTSVKRDDSISDTLETSDREADGRQTIVPTQIEQSDSSDECHPTTDRLDLTG